MYTCKSVVENILVVSAVLTVPNFILQKHHMDQTKLKMLVLLHATKLFAICQHINLLDPECSKSKGKSVQYFITLFHCIQKNSVI